MKSTMNITLSRKQLVTIIVALVIIIAALLVVFQIQNNSSALTVIAIIGAGVLAIPSILLVSLPRVVTHSQDTIVVEPIEIKQIKNYATSVVISAIFTVFYYVFQPTSVYSGWLRIFFPLATLGWLILLIRRWKSGMRVGLFRHLPNQPSFSFWITKDIAYLISALTWVVSVVFGAGVHQATGPDYLGYFLGLVFVAPVILIGVFFLHRLVIRKKLAGAVNKKQVWVILLCSIALSLVIYFLLSFLR